MADEKTHGREAVIATSPQRHARLALTLPSPASGRGERQASGRGEMHAQMSTKSHDPMTQFRNTRLNKTTNKTARNFVFAQHQHDLVYFSTLSPPQQGCRMKRTISAMLGSDFLAIASTTAMAEGSLALDPVSLWLGGYYANTSVDVADADAAVHVPGRAVRASVDAARQGRVRRRRGRIPLVVRRRHRRVRPRTRRRVLPGESQPRRHRFAGRRVEVGQRELGRR